MHFFTAENVALRRLPERFGRWNSMWKRFSRLSDSGSFATAIGIAALVVFIALALGYGFKVAPAPEAVAEEFSHPIAGNLFGTILTSLLPLDIVTAPFAFRLAQGLWMIGAICMFAFAWLIITRWMSDRQ